MNKFWLGRAVVYPLMMGLCVSGFVLKQQTAYVYMLIMTIVQYEVLAVLYRLLDIQEGKNHPNYENSERE